MLYVCIYIFKYGYILSLTMRFDYGGKKYEREEEWWGGGTPSLYTANRKAHVCILN